MRRNYIGGDSRRTYGTIIAIITDVADDPELIGDLLIEEGLVTREELIESLSQADPHDPLVEALLDCGQPRRSELAQWLARRVRVPKIRDLRALALRPPLTRLVPEELARRSVLLPVAKMGSLLFVARPHLQDPSAIRDVRRITGLKVKLLLGDEAQVKAAIECLYGDRRTPIPAPATDTRRIGLISAAHPNGGGPPLMEAVRVPDEMFETRGKAPFAEMVLYWKKLLVEGRPVPAARASRAVPPPGSFP
ncbi:MAG: hypothetical protein HY716_09270 [Planctomycetes bacterium]|nr:hypothetical protein [Planctomycetota bacterium]